MKNIFTKNQDKENTKGLLAGRLSDDELEGVAGGMEITGDMVAGTMGEVFNEVARGFVGNGVEGISNGIDNATDGLKNLFGVQA